MSSTGAGYDYSVGTFSPDGRIFQVEYAHKAVSLHGTAIGMKCSDGVVMAVEKPMVSKMLVSGSNKRGFGVDKHAGMIIAGVSADGRQIVNRAREEASNYESTYGSKIPPTVLADRLALFMHYCTLYGSLRPFGATSLTCAYDFDLKRPELYMIEPSGQCLRYFACAAGKGAQAARTELEKILTKNQGTNGITCAEAVKHFARILNTIRDPTKDKPFELEMGWLCETNDFQYKMVPSDIVESALNEAKAAEGSAPEESSSMEVA
jgi:20S proteasome subunit alpha 7